MGLIICPPTSFSDYRTGASEKIRSTPRKTFFNRIDPERQFATAICRIAKRSFDHLVGGRKQRLWDGKP
jgi:hypothetical protein